MTRLAVLSDIHGNLPALEAVVADAAGAGCTAFVNLGDILSGPLWPRETAEYLMARDWVTIAGNHERAVLDRPLDRMGPSDRFARDAISVEQTEWLRSLPPLARLDGGIALVHGTAASDVEPLLETIEDSGARHATESEIIARLGDDDARLTLCGHTHVQRLVDLSDGRRVVNPGSVGLPGYAVWRPVRYVMEAGDPRARYAIVDADLSVELRAVEYDFELAARRADDAGRDDWSHPLRTGRALTRKAD